MERILVLERDDKMIRNELERNRFDVVEQCCVLSAIEYVVNNPVSLIICVDPFHHSLGASELLTIARGDHKLKSIPILVVTYYDTKIDTFYKAGASDVLIEPLDSMQLLNCVHKICLNYKNQKAIETFAGSFQTIGLIEILQILMSAQKNGLLVCDFKQEQLDLPEQDGQRGDLIIKDGQIVGASYKSLLGEDGVAKIFSKSLKGGFFLFDQGAQYEAALSKINDHSRITKRTDHLLLSVASSVDEGKSDTSSFKIE
jgi:DNA-binding response OmpR family regulator